MSDAIESSELSWSEYIKNQVVTSITLSSVTERLDFLNHSLLLRLRRKGISEEDLPSLLTLIKLTYTRYQDRASRQAILDVFTELNNWNAIYFQKTIVPFLFRETEKICKRSSTSGECSTAASSRFVLLSWVNHIESLILETKDIDNDTTAKLLTMIINTQGILIESLGSSSTIKQSIWKSVIADTRRTIRNHPKRIPELFKYSLANSSCTPTYINAILIGTIVDVCFHLKYTDGKPFVVDIQSSLIDYYLKNIISSRSAVPQSSMIALNAFISKMITQDIFEQQFLPILEKMMLRSPEVVLPCLANIVPCFSFDPSTIFESKWKEPLSNHLRSTSLAVRLGASSLWRSLCEKCHDISKLNSVVDVITKPLTTNKVSTPDHRIVMYEAALNLSSNHDATISAKVLDGGLFTMLTKESNELALVNLIKACGKHISILLYNDAFCKENKSLMDKVVKVITDGLVSTKAAVRHQWANTIGTTYWIHDQPSLTLSDQIIKYLQPLATTTNKMQDKPLVWKDGPLEGYVLVALLSGRVLSTWNKDQQQNNVNEFVKKQNYPKSVLGNSDGKANKNNSSSNNSFLLLDRIYMKALTVEEGIWLTRAITSLFAQTEQSVLDASNSNDTSIGFSMAQIMIWILSSHPHYQVRQQAYESISSLSNQQPEKLSHFMIQALNQWLLDLEKETKGSVAVTALHATTAAAANMDPLVAKYRLASVLMAMTSFSQIDANIKSSILVELVLLAHHQSIVSSAEKFNWITLVQRANVDPGKLVQQHDKRLKELVWKSLSTDNNDSELFYKAGLSVISTLSFIDTPTFFGSFASELQLDPKLMNGVEELQYNIWKTPDDMVYVDVLKKKNDAKQTSGNRKNKDQDWEDQLRAELAAKKGVERKLTKEEQNLVNAQMKKEKDIRQQVQKVYDQMTLGLNILRALTTNVDVTSTHGTSISILLSSIEKLLNMAQSNAGLLLQEELVDTYLHLARATLQSANNTNSAYVENIVVDAIGLATLRSHQVNFLPSRWLDEPLVDLVNRVLYKLKFLTESQPLTTAAFSYSFPVLYQVIKNNGISCTGEAAVEQVSLALDILHAHAHLGNDTSNFTCRKQMLEILLYTIREYPGLSKLAKSTLIELSTAMADTLVTPDEYQALFNGLLSDESTERHAALQGLELLDLTEIDYSAELWLACHDDESDANATLANSLWEDNGLDVDGDNYSEQLLSYVTCDYSSYVRSAASGAIAKAMELYPETVMETLREMYSIYKLKSASLEPEYDKFGMVIPETLDRQDPWQSRSGLALAFKKSAQYLQVNNVIGFCEFLINDQALGDRHEQVRKQMVDAGLAVVNAYGKQDDVQQQMLQLFESYLAKEKSAKDDDIRQSVVILYGGCAGYLKDGDPKIRAAVDNLIETLDTPSEVVQSAVAECLPALIKKIKEDVPSIVEGLLKKLYGAEKYAQRRGAAYGLAGVVKGRGITALKECNIMTSLKDAVDNKRNYQYRQGALFAFETLSGTLGRLFEPYIIQIIPLLLVCFSDTNMDVREASADAGRVIMSKISGHCVKLILPSILEGLDERQWRTKKASVELLGSMAYCAPKQLSVSLPNIIPSITEVLADTHAQVQNAANRSLQMFGEVISNPEIQQLVPELLEALSDPNRKTMVALKKLLQTSFVHYIDSPSLAIVMPILERGLRERGTEIKTKSAQIVGNMASLTDQKDLVPYLPVILPRIKEVLSDPVPEARGTAAKAIGGLVEKLGEDNFPGLVIELFDSLKTDTGSVDRQGAAQGLAEILAGLGLERLDGLLPEIIANADSPRPYVREGFISLLVYLPATYGPRFQPYIGRIIPPILMGLADESEFVRDASLKAGRMIVTNYATKAVDLLLPELEKGLFDMNWRIRQSSVQLVGDLLFRITGMNNPNKSMQALGNVELLDDEDVDDVQDGGQGQRKHQLRDVLGKDRGDRILSALYIVRRDSSGMVRQASLQVWKALVSNTPRTLRDILPTMMGMIIQLLASDEEHYEQRAVAARTIADLVTKLGERVLPDILPILQDSMQSSDSSIRQGVTVAYSEVMAAAERVQILDFADQIVPAIRQALCDSSVEVREAAAQAFDTLHQNVGSRAIDDILPYLLNQLKANNETSDYALSALKEIMAVRANVVFPVLIPNLIQVPINAFNAGALASLVTVAGPTLNKRLTSILDALIESRVLLLTPGSNETYDELDEEEKESTIEQLKQTSEALMLSIEDDEGLEALMDYLIQAVKDDTPQRRSVACDMVANFFSESQETESEIITERMGDWISALILLLNDHDLQVVQSAWNALTSVVKSMDKEQYEEYVSTSRRAIGIMSSPGINVRGFCDIPKGLGCILPIFLQGLMYGSTENREQSALAIGDLIERTTDIALKPFVTQMTGPLIRIVGDRYPSPVKSAILHTLGLLLNKVPLHVKPFLPQLQRTFIKSLQEPEQDIRDHAAEALKVLIPLQLRVDPLVTELVSGIRTCTDMEVKNTMMKSLNDVVVLVGTKMNDVSKKGIQSVIQDGESDHDHSEIQSTAALLQSSFASL
ncbi:unnamed protein product [Cunninghamella blakesleeana]